MSKVKQVYYSHHFLRSLMRKNDIKKNSIIINKNHDARILVILHLFYQQSWKEIQEYLDNLSCYNYKLIVTVTEGKVSQDTLDQIKKFKPGVKIILCKNLGWDLRPFLLALKRVNLDNYDIVFKLQSKSTKRSWLYIYDQLFMRRDWFLDLFDGCLSSKVVHTNIDTLLNNETVGLLAAKNLIVNDPPHKVQMVKEIAQKNNLKISDDYRFVAGTCFAIKAKCLKNIQKYQYTDDDFRSTPTSRGMSFAHFFERYICTQVRDVHHMNLIGVPIRKVRHKILSIPCKILYHYSSNRLFDENIDFDPEFFYWALDNRLITWKYKYVPFKKIYYSAPGIEIPFIENAPYKYLKGDIDEYKKYCEQHEKDGLPLMSIDRFEKLRKSINKNGYDERHIIIIGDKNRLLDGQHRACCLCDKLGEDASIKVLKIHFIGIKSIIRNLIPRWLIILKHNIKNK